ncbi:hypothetical protein EDB81DRAFT_952184, partial [Dactylonectria macrodidyma]
MSTETPKSPPAHDEANDSDSDVIGFADAPYPREEPARNVAVATDPPPVTTTTNTTAPYNTTTTTNTTPPAPDPPPRVVLKAWRQNVSDILVGMVLFLPWTAGMIVSYMPLTRISAADATREVLLCIITSTIEVGSILLFPTSNLVFSYLAPHSRPLTWRIPNKALTCWIFWLFLDPVVTGSYVWAYINDHPCEAGSGSAQCRIGDGLIRAVGIFRTFGIFGLAMILVAISNIVKDVLEKQQRAVDSAENL